MKKFLLGVVVGVVALLSVDALAIYANQFVKVTPLLKTTASWDGAAIAYPAGTAELSAMIVELAPGGETGWHLHTVPSVAMMLEGEIEVHLKDGRIRPFKQGEALAEVIHTLHNGKNRGKSPAKMAVFYAGVEKETMTLTEAEALLKGL
ncbi:MAG: cupin domain-containing protein [Candidatus Hydrogenedentes bacterium]|nr:cupin domain-containing protein [Candidatus Hydrogenedentota bacterium]